MQGVNDVAGGFARHFPGVEGLSGGGDFHGFRKAGWTGLRPLLKVRELVGEFVLKKCDLFEKFFLNVLGHPLSMAGSGAAPSAEDKKTFFSIPLYAGSKKWYAS